MELDICSIGNAIVDIQFNIEDEFKSYLVNNSIAFGTMTLIEQEDQENLIKELSRKYGKASLACGGSIANSTFAASNFGSPCHLACKVNDDDFGHFFLNNLKENNIFHTSQTSNSDSSTGRSVIMVTPDAERTMCTFLGVSSLLTNSDIDRNMISNSKYLFIEGYLVTSPSALNCCKEAINIAINNDTKVAISLSDPGIVNNFRNEIETLIDLQCDLLFCNKAEALAFTEKNSLNEAHKVLRDSAESFLITLHEHGCLTWNGKEISKLSGYEAKAIDTNGAGDMFAGAVLHALCSGEQLNKAAKFGCYAASVLVASFGPRLETEEYKKIKNNF